MSKALEALEDIILYLNASEPKGLYCENIETIQQSLLELQSIKEAKPSEALECLEHIKKDDFNMIITTYPPLPAYNGVTKDEMFDKIEQSLLKAEKEHKELEIIKKKEKR